MDARARAAATREFPQLGRIPAASRRSDGGAAREIAPRFAPFRHGGPLARRSFCLAGRSSWNGQVSSLFCTETACGETQMFCEAYNQSLKDAVASGEALTLALQQHLASCESCRAAFAGEQSLFAAIDSGLRAAANSEVPTTLTPRVHVAINNKPTPQPRRFPLPVWGFAGAVVTAATVLALLYVPSRRPPIPVEP